MKEDFFRFQAQTTTTPLGIEVERAEGSYIYDISGKAYLDLISGIGVSNIGHRHPHVVQAVKKQVDKYMHTMVYGEFYQEAQTELARKLASLLPGQLSVSYFVNSGTEANEAALKLAKRYTGRSEIIGLEGAYHGSTHGSLSVSTNEAKKAPFQPLLPEVNFMRINAVEDLNKISKRTACVIIEPVQGDAGVRIADKNWLQQLRQRCDETGALLIFDEVQSGMGRCGSLFAFEQLGVVPDILTTAKGLGGGMPIGAFISSREIMDHLTFDPMLGHITTFGGHPVNCAAALATLEVIEDEQLLDQVESKGQLLESLIQHPAVKTIRRIGLMFAIDLENEELVYKMVDRCLDKGLITFFFLSHPSSFRIAPPLTISDEEIRESGRIMMEVLSEISGQ